MSVPLKIRKFIINRVSDLFDSIKEKVLGLNRKNSLFFNLYMDAYRGSSGMSFPDPEQIEELTHTSGRYIDTLKLKTINEIVDTCQKASESTLNIPVSEQIDKSFKHLDMIVTTQAQTFQNMGAIEGIADLAGKSGDDDPSVYFLGPNDDKTCPTCLELYFMPDGKTPRIWKVSELGSGFFKRGDCCPSVSPIHPRCRHYPIYVPKGHGFVRGHLKKLSRKK